MRMGFSGQLHQSFVYRPYGNADAASTYAFLAVYQTQYFSVPTPGHETSRDKTRPWSRDLKSPETARKSRDFYP